MKRDQMLQEVYCTLKIKDNQTLLLFRFRSASFLEMKLMKLNDGPVINVVAIAINTIIEKISGESTFRSNPIFNTINSINPLVFINAPSERESFQDWPTNFAASILPPNLPPTATAMIQPKATHKE